jgi:hypothetical protein
MVVKYLFCKIILIMIENNYQFVILCCTPRSGSSTLVRILNTIPNTNICGENDGAIINLLKFYRSIKNTISYRKSNKNPSNLSDIIDDKMCPAWYNSFDYDNIILNIKQLIINMFNTENNDVLNFKENSNPKMIGFKEIRFFNEMYLLNLFKELFPNTKFVINIKKDIDSQSTSKHYDNISDSVNIIDYLNNYNTELVNFHNSNKNNSYLCYFEDIITNNISELFNFLNMGNFCEKNNIDKILSQNYTSIYWKYNSLIPNNFNVNIYRELNMDLVNMTSFDLIKHYVDYGIHENRSYKYNVIIQTTVQNENHIIIEWIEHNIKLGIDHIYIYDDCSDISLNTYLCIHLKKEYIDKITIFRINYNVFTEYEVANSDNNNKQLHIMNHFICHYKHVSKWCLFCDVDEFININNDNTMKITTFMEQYEHSNGIFIPWLNFGSSYHINQPEGSICKKFKCHNSTYDLNGKSLCKLDILNKITDSHKIVDNLIIFTEKIPICLNHYQICSIKTYLKRKLRYEFGSDFGILRSPLYLYNNMLSYNGINYNMTNIYVDILVNDNQPIFTKNTLITFNFLKKLSQSDSLRYMTLIELFKNNKFIEFKKKYDCSIRKIIRLFINEMNVVDSNNSYYNINNNINFDIFDDFNISEYRALNSDLTNMSDSDIVKHYLDYGKKENRLCKLEDIPADFDCSIYKKLNNDLEYLSDVNLKKHWCLNGKKENRLYKQTLPSNFIPSMYLFLNPDLEKYTTDLELEIHYEKYGKDEKRKYIDESFDAEYFVSKNNYKNISSSNVKECFNEYTKNINQHKNKYFKDKLKNAYQFYFDYRKIIFLVNHSDSFYGASNYLYLLFNKLKNIYKNKKFYLLDIRYSIKVTQKYKINKNEILEYHGDPTMLLGYYNKLNPELIYFNSYNYSYYHAIKYIKKEKYILHSHEIKDHYVLSQTQNPDFVVSSIISKQYTDRSTEHYPKIQPPFISNCNEIFNKANENFVFNCNVTQKNKINICMCGEITERKNYKLFIEVAKVFKQYNFIWIGGDATKSYIFNDIDNVIHVPFVNNPYRYYKQVVDYFILFSQSDPCPFVILENILLGTPIITFKNNIYTSHKNCVNQDKSDILDFYNEYDGSISLNNCIDAINTIVKTKKTKYNQIVNSQKGLKYINKYFSEPTEIVKYIDKL